MKFTLAFDIYNKESTIESLLTSWLDACSMRHEIEVVMIFDDLHDDSGIIARNVLGRYSLVHNILMSADNKYEIHCNNLAFQRAHGDFIVFIQDDNWMYDQNWDDTLARVLNCVPNVGIVGLLAGSDIHNAVKWDRFEINRSHKGSNYTTNLADVLDAKLGVWAVDSVCRPFGLYTKQLEEFRGLDLSYCPMEFDDMDVCTKALKYGLTNIYIPFDVVNTTGRSETISADIRSRCWTCGRACWNRYHGPFIAQTYARTKPRMLFPLVERGGGIYLK